MILVADAGGTKTDWRILRGDKIDQLVTRGYNPNTHDLHPFLDEVMSHFHSSAAEVEKIYFYGASLYPTSTVFIDALGSRFEQAHITVNNDLFGSCRSLSGDKSGFVGILGTGSAGCFYDGEKVVIHPPSLGYALGDEGSGALLGRALLKAAFRKKLDADLLEKFDQTFQLSKEQVYTEVYRGDHPNTYLGSFTRFLNDHRDHPQIYKLLRAEFEAYFTAYFQDMPGLTNHPFHFSGSIAFHFGDILREVAVERGYTVGRIVQSPIAGLALYHQEHG
jgi:N-acetylglucosamine kinase-like BadF-type ATPase